jgi:hypothetical protein
VEIAPFEGGLLVPHDVGGRVTIGAPSERDTHLSWLSITHDLQESVEVTVSFARVDGTATARS